MPVHRRPRQYRVTRWVWTEGDSTEPAPSRGPGHIVAPSSAGASGGDGPCSWREPPAEFIDPARLAELRTVEAHGAPGLVGQLFAAFFAQAAVDLATLTSAATARDARLASEASHRLRGAAGTMGADGLADVCAALEAASDSGDLAEYPTLLERLQYELAGVASTVDALSRP